VADGWRTARASDVGMDEQRLAALVQRIADTVPTLIRAPLIHSLLIARHGRLVLEEYFYGHDRDRTHDIRSAGKTFASVLLGVAMMRGVKVAPETPLVSLMDGAPFANPDPRKGRITLAHLMTHSSGLACDDNDDDSPGNENTMQGQTAQPDYWKYMMDLPMTHDPGAYYAYCSGSMNLMSAALTRATGTWLPAYFDETVARPLQFRRYHFNLTPTREGYLGGGAWLRPRDLLKVGQLYLDGGVWNGTRIVPRAWVERSIAPKISWPSRGENVSAGTDGFAWHLNTIKAAGREYREYEANGNGGQLLMVVPELDLVVVFTAGNYMFGGVWSRFRNDLLPNAIIPAIQR
jgi:CubicO group peptidase (beta-lactamase class C family)